MNKLILTLALALAAAPVFAQNVNSTTSGTGTGMGYGQAGATAATGNITFEAAKPLEHQRIDTTPTIYAPPSMFGGANNCGQASTVGVGFTGFGLGGSLASESEACNAREDTSIAYKLGFKDVADMRFFCFGEDVNRKAYEATGHTCPAGSTAKGLTVAASAAELKVAQQKVAQQKLAQQSAKSGKNDQAAVVQVASVDTARRQAADYWGTDPIVMSRLGITR